MGTRRKIIHVCMEQFMIQRTYLSRSKATQRLEHTPRAVERERSIQDEPMIFRMIFRRKCMKIVKLQGHEFRIDSPQKLRRQSRRLSLFNQSGQEVLLLRHRDGWIVGKSGGGDQKNRQATGEEQEEESTGLPNRINSTGHEIRLPRQEPTSRTVKRRRRLGSEKVLREPSP